MLSFFPRGVSDEILNLIESVSEGLSFLLFQRITTTSIMIRFSVYFPELGSPSKIQKAVYSKRKEFAHMEQIPCLLEFGKGCKNEK